MASQEEAIKLLGHNSHLRKHLQEIGQVRIVDRGTRIIVTGERDSVDRVARVVDDMIHMIRNGLTPTERDVNASFRPADPGETPRDIAKLTERPEAIRSDMAVRPRTNGQREYLDMIEQHAVTLAIGPAGTGKTYLAVAAAASALKSKKVRRIILTRPVVEAGESLGFLPGDLEQKVNPYVRPLYDALDAMLGIDRRRKKMETQEIEVAPLAYMRGRTLDDAFVILDEAQNTTREQMKMFLTRLGNNSKMVITGDVSQIDLPRGVQSGLVHAEAVLRAVTGIGKVYLQGRDIVRHPLVQAIVEAYDHESSDDASLPRARAKPLS